MLTDDRRPDPTGNFVVRWLLRLDRWAGANVHFIIYGQEDFYERWPSQIF